MKHAYAGRGGEALRRPGHRPCAGRQGPGRELPCRRRLCGDVGARTSGDAQGAGGAGRKVQALAGAGSADSAGEDGDEGHQKDPQPVPRRQEADERQGNEGHRLRDGLRARGRTDFSLYLRAGGMQQTCVPPVDFLDDRRGHPRGLRRPAARLRLRRALPQRALPGGRGLAHRHERHARLYAALRRAIVHRARADADALHAGQAPQGDRRVCAADVLHGARGFRRLQGRVRRFEGRKAHRQRGDGGRHRRTRFREGGPRRAGRPGEEDRAPAAALRPDDAPARGQRAAGLYGQKDAGDRAEALRAAQAADLSAHRQPVSLAGHAGQGQKDAGKLRRWAGPAGRGGTWLRRAADPARV